MAVIDRFCEVYEQLADLNLDDLEGLYGSDVVFQDPVTTHTGLAAVKAYFSGLLQNTSSCMFTIHNVIDCADNREHIDHVVVWTMTLETSALKKGQPVTLDGTTLLRIEDGRISYHRDYYDMGEMIYENVPLLGSIIRSIKKRMVQS